ncbi:CRISPR associated protein Cas2 [Kingella denitrificans]|uniref:Virulence-associated protein D (VapD) conserved region n=1 Tax=Kingella denitrificans ATCC 33394 TaxID=888741 RepID=F0EYE4_9NEIS|nr:virulence-associated protein VapD [Kingella denitrificans]EGC17552.1 Virulence-associated protein D (VapD) conserved region [Kingella denitrificans ATCC 33394]QQB41545.1 VapD [Kingella denitrificans]STR12612.1 CRISPR associated protein Cas2 [Kingella denitrificans]
MSRYLITFDMDTNCLKDNYHGNSYTNAYGDIRNIFHKHGFENIQGSVYLGREGISEAHGTIAIQELTARFDWFYSCISNIRFYRLESDLNAQFIADGVYQAKQAFLQRIEQLRLSLVEAGLSDEQIKQVIEKQKFELEHNQPGNNLL